MNQAQGGSVLYKFIGDDKDLNKTINSVKTNLGAVGKVLGTLGSVVAGVSITAVTELATITAASVKAYGEMEQLAGGAQKIFDEIDYETIAKDAREAYKTMNLSASEYLALINDVGATFAATMGDQKGYDAAKKGLQAISDYASGTGKNVNLLGQKFTMITRATTSYQTIADQFSGILPATSQAFLEQAQAAGLLSSEYKKLTEVPIDEYQQAVSEMLAKGVENLGLANNTLMESTNTVTGSVAAAKAAVQNFLSGAGGIDEVVETVVTMGTQIGKAVVEMLPKIVEGIVGIVNGLIPYIPQLIETLLPTLLEGTVALIRGLVAAAPTFITTIAEMLPTLVTEFVNMFVEVANAFAEQAPIIMPIVVNAIIDALIALFDNIDVIIEACLALVIGLTEGIIKSLPVLIERLPDMIESVLNALIDLYPMIIEAGWKLIPQLVIGIIEALPQIYTTFQTLVRETIPNALANGAVRLWEAGKDIIKGIWEGIKNFDIVGKIKELAKSMLNGMKKALGIHSPSKEFAFLGKMSMLGYTEQLEDMKGMLDKVIDDTFSLSPQLSTGDLHYSPNVIVNNNITSNTDSLGQTVTNIKTFANGAKNDYNYGMGV